MNHNTSLSLKNPLNLKLLSTNWNTTPITEHLIPREEEGQEEERQKGQERQEKPADHDNQIATQKSIESCQASTKSAES